VRLLLGYGFKLLFSGNEAMAATWKKLTAQADQRSEEDRQRVVVSETVKREATTGVNGSASGLGVIFCLPAFKVLYTGTSPAWN